MILVRERLLTVLSEPVAAANVRAYFAEAGPGHSTYTGRLFEQFGGGGDREGRANAFTADDLIAVESLSVQVPPEAAYALLHGSVGEELARLLSQVPTDVDLGSPEAHTHLGEGSAADRAWASLKALPGIGWVTGGKLLARKRPKLLPVYDNVVRCVLGEPKGIWLALDSVLADSEVQKQLAPLRPVAPGRDAACLTLTYAQIAASWPSPKRSGTDGYETATPTATRSAVQAPAAASRTSSVPA